MTDTRFPHRPLAAPLAALAAVLALAAAGPAAAAGPQAATAGPATAAAAAPLRYEGYPVEPRAHVADTELVLNGYGRRLALGIYKPYAAAFYLPHRLATGAAVFADPGPKRLQLRMLVSGSSGYFVEAFDKGIRKRVPADQREAMQPRIEAFDALVRGCGDLKTGDLVNLDYVPGKGTVLSLNGKVHGAPVPGADLYNAMLAIFLGDTALDKPLGAALLGGPPN